LGIDLYDKKTYVEAFKIVQHWIGEYIKNS
jgi:hypothetical protein